MLGTVTTAALAAGVDLYSKIAGAVAATLTVLYMIRKLRREKIKNTLCEKCLSDEK